jgi:predicted branched-subunit amino acid permease
MEQLPVDLTGIDFSMTALFIVICLERALNRAERLPVAIGGACAVICLLVLGPDNFLAPALALTAVLLMMIQAASGRKEEAQ